MRKGSTPISLLALRFKIDRNFASQENFEMIIAMYLCNNFEVFHTKSIQLIIDYNWKQCQIYVWTISILFYIFLVLLSVYSQIWFQNHEAEVALFCYNSFFFIYEVIQASSRPKIYFSTTWNYIDLMRILLLYAYIIYSWSEGDSYALMGMLSFVIMLSYLKSLSYLRAINSMSNVFIIYLASYDS